VVGGAYIIIEAIRRAQRLGIPRANVEMNEG
jgi:hypothetical protein